ncbi:MAG: type III-A CRISPR-associated RAMP protein Csm5 [Desulfobaccales bacterium]
MPETVTCLIRTLAPVHLGSGEVYEPLGFVIDEQKPCLVAFEPGDFLNLLPETDRRRFLEICRKGTVDSLLEIYRFYHQHRQRARGREVAVCPGIVQHYREVLNVRGDDRKLRTTINQFTIHRTAFLSHDQRPYIPGTAIKGALRTAYLNARAQIKQLPTPKDNRGRWDPRALENQLLDYRRIDEDPFRLLKVSDFLPVGEVRTRIIYAINEKKRVSQFAARGPYQILEVIEPGAEFVGTISLEEIPPNLRSFYKIRHFLQLDDIWKAARNFYAQEKEKEDQVLFEISVPAVSLPAGNGAVALRLGRHSGAECVTIAGHRKIKILQAQGQPPKTMDHATTLWLVADFHQRDKRHQAHLRPFGWVSFSELTPDQASLLKERERSWQEESESSRRAATVGVPSSYIEAGHQAGPPARPVTIARQETWEGAVLTYEKGRQELIASWQGKRARAKGLELVPPELRESLSGKKAKGAKAKVVVEVEGNAYRIISIQLL